MTAAAVLAFWFGEPDDGGYQSRTVWFTKDPKFDEQVRQFLPVYQQAAVGELGDWQQTALGSLALILVLDQFPRNMFRDTPRSFWTDPLALTVAKQAVAQRLDQQLPSRQRMFFYLPFEHSENPNDQEQCVALFSHLDGDEFLKSTLDYAKRHQQVITQFGRFPHRNRILDRPSTPAELEFLRQPGSSF
ncbi:DUF924 family protein [Candidatus Cyanaurora vandensis]|uniref:DUF924 family protein n=1 Tax=Candidatus Cyanaurora vandensis TaxID=2714958 RepID=UPI00257D3B01|nr:DUF924 family protein [Candidatus Cyanaurora vandensis]